MQAVTRRLEPLRKPAIFIGKDVYSKDTLLYIFEFPPLPPPSPTCFALRLSGEGAKNVE
jgi:hypothetical protein